MSDISLDVMHGCFDGGAHAGLASQASHRSLAERIAEVEEPE